jgi:hypothetical protein
MGAAPMGARFVAGPLEPGLAAYVDLPTPAPSEASDNGLSWADYRKCTTCGAETGDACVALYSKIINGQPAGDRALLPRAHGHRHKRAGR